MQPTDFRFYLISSQNEDAKDAVYAELAAIARTYKLAEELGEGEVSNFPEVKKAMIDILVKHDIIRLEVPGHDAEKQIVVANGWETKSACTAINSYYYYGTYSHPATQPYLHVRTKSAELGQQKNVGYIHFGLTAEALEAVKEEYRSFALVTIPPAPEKENHNEWSILKNELDFFKTDIYLGMGRHGKAVIAKHKWIDWFVRGHGVHLWVGKGEDRDNYATTFLMEWMQETPERAIAIARERMDAANERKDLRRGFAVANRQVIEGTTTQDADEDTGEVKLLASVYGQGRRVNLLKVPMQAVILYDKRGSYVGNETWDPNNPATVLRFRGNDLPESDPNHIVGIVKSCQLKLVG